MESSEIQDALGERFTVVREIGHGGMAIVYLAHDNQYDRAVALKILRPELVDPRFAERFLREVRLEGQLQHPHVLPIYESGTAGRFLYYIMPYVDGETLRARLASQGPLEIEEAIRVTREVAEALSAAHARGIVHRDVKPANILLSGGHAVLADFGVARALAESVGGALTSAGIAVGTPTYMSPEQSSGGAQLDARSDIYSLGCVLFEMLAGEPPFTGRTSAVIMAKHCAAPVPSLAVERPGAPPALVQVVSRALAKVPADRFKDTESLIKALDQAGTEAVVSTAMRQSRRRRFSGVAVVTLALTSLMLFVGWYLSRPTPLALDAAKIVVFPLADRSGSGPTDVDQIIGTALDHTEPLRWISSWNSLTPGQRQDPGTISQRTFRQISRDLGAGFYITGQLLRRPDSVFVELQLYDTRGDSLVDSGRGRGPLGVTTESQAALLALTDLLQPLVDPGRPLDLSLFMERSPAAITNFIQGEREYRLSRFAEALEFYERALDVDPQMTFAAMKGAQAASWSHRSEQARNLIDRALQTAGPLPARHRLFLEGLHAYMNGAADTALAKLGGALREDPDWSAAWMVAGEVHQHLLPKGVSNDSAIAYFRLAAADPGFTPPLIHLTEHAIREGRSSEAKKMLQRLGNEADPVVLHELEVMWQCVEHGPEEADFKTLVQSDPRAVYDAAVVLSAGAMQAACARAGFEALLASDAWATPYSWAAAQGLQGLLIAQGYTAEAERFLAGIVASAPSAHTDMLRRAGQSSLFLAILNSSGGALMPELTEQALTTARTIYGANYERIRGIRTPWLLANLHGLRGETATIGVLRDYLVATAELPADPPSDSAAIRSRDARFYADVLTAHLSLMAGDTQSAIQQLEGLTHVATSEQVWNTTEASLAPERLALARIYLDRGDYMRAHNVAAAFDHQGPLLFLAFVPTSLEIRWKAALGLGDAQLAERYTRRLAALGREDLLNPGS